MPSAFIVEAVRTPGGRRDGQFSHWHPADLGGWVIDNLVARSGVDPKEIDDVIYGCVSQSGAQSGNVARNSVLSSCLPESVPGTSVDRQCGSSQQALHFAAQAVMSGTQDIVIAGGVEIMSKVPIGSAIADAFKQGHGMPFDGEKMTARYPGVRFSQFAGAEMIAEKWNLSREELNRFAYASHTKAVHATENGYFDREIVPTQTVTGDMGTRDEGIRFDADFDKINALEPLVEGGYITAGNASQICDGAAAVLVVNEAGLKKLQKPARAQIIQLSLAGSDPVVMLSGPIPATQTALKKAGLKITDIDLYEVNEAFSPVPLAWAKDVDADLDKLNVNGGAMALGHPLGATGAKLMTTLLHEIERRDAELGLQAICEGGGTANATIIKRL